MGDSPQALPCPSSTMRPRMMVSSLSLSVPTCTVGVAHHSTWILTDFAKLPLHPHFSPPASGPLSWRPPQDSQGQTWEGSCLGPGVQGREGETRGTRPSLRAAMAQQPPPTLHHPSGWPHGPCLPGEDPRGLGGGSGQQRGG